MLSSRKTNTEALRGNRACGGGGSVRKRKKHSRGTCRSLAFVLAKTGSRVDFEQAPDLTWFAALQG